MRRVLLIALVALTACATPTPVVYHTCSPSYVPACPSPADPGDDRTPDERGCVETSPGVWSAEPGK